ncbi:NADPH-dependent F420 reductase [Paeniglutamicibacter psychrophenolicus]|uniref:NADPH-dependent F420 reductase n=1 Tax=Paeniglutamicibacter psychrophenolicus TaxID=257454 RepID=UPI0027857E0D|nr:NAD(P)-binding domain-containing protein [Paeniglutamicibacter psychrophenolicus]MDQ0092403.1 putative dinucleotide-binding enzyme [Paeniglutamicibacter psychrophenolicus]
MEQVTIIGNGHMARSIAVRMLQARRSVQILGRNGEKTRDLVEFLGAGARGGAEGAPIDGGIVFLAVPYNEGKDAMLVYGDALAGKVVVDISNPVDLATFDKLLVPSGTSAAEEIAVHASPEAHVVKAFNTCLAKPLEAGSVAGLLLDVFIAGDSEQAKVEVSAVVAASGLRPIDVGPLRRARELEAMMLLVMGLQVSPDQDNFNWDTSLKLLP